jgi:ubiquinone/menaquinone biosynthesis C-methylase UbiE
MHNRFFDLEQRVPVAENAVQTVDRARGYDLSARISMRFPMERVVSLLSPYYKEGSQVVEVGSSTGLLSLMFGAANPGTLVLGVEENVNMLAVAEENATLATMAHTPARVEFKRGKFHRLPVIDESADIVFSFLTLYRSSDPVRLLQECARIVKPDGLVFFYEMARDAEEGMISFILQYVNTGQEEFMTSLKASYSSDELNDLLKAAGLDGWHLVKEQLNVRISNREM